MGTDFKLFPMPISLILLTLLSLPGLASIFGSDDRVDTKFASAEAQELAKSVPALIQKYRLKKLADGKIELMGQKIGLCHDEAFAEEKNIANCSASLISKNKILTAAHCLDDSSYACGTYSIVFDYQRNEIPMTGSHILDSAQVYNCKSIVFSKFDQRLQGIDLAIIELDREVTDRRPVELDLSQNLQVNDPLILIGYPMGISQKVVESGKVLSVDYKNISFKHDLDSFSVNSGSPIFSKDRKQVGVLVRGSGLNFTNFDDRSCLGWHVDDGKGYSEGNDLSQIPWR